MRTGSLTSRRAAALVLAAGSTGLPTAGMKLGHLAAMRWRHDNNPTNIHLAGSPWSWCSATESPDVLWALGGLDFWIIEAKSGATSEVIHKRDANQLASSMNWFRVRYDTTAHATPVMVHPARQLSYDATATPCMKVLTGDGLARLRSAILAFAAGLASDRWDNADSIDSQLQGHELRASDLPRYVCNYRAAR